MTLERITKKQAMLYEVSTSWWSSWMIAKWMQDMASRYFAWKVHRKWKRYIADCEMCERVKRKQKAETAA